MTQGIGQNWLNSQASRRYPLADSATGIGVAGDTLRDDIIVDLRISWPEIAGKVAFLGGVTVTENIVTAVILAADSVTEQNNFTPIAAVSLAKPVTRHRYYTLDALYPQAGGFIAFGDVDELCTVKLASPREGLLAPRVARPFKSLPIPGMRKDGRSDKLTGIVKLVAGTDIEITSRKVPNEEDEEHDRDVIIVRLTTPTLARNVLAEYIGPCGARPESQNCDRDGVQTIGGVSPDCDGNIDILFKSMDAIGYVGCGDEEDHAGVTLEQSVNLEEVCDARAKVRARFPGEDYCESSAELSVGLDDFSDVHALTYPPEEPDEVSEKAATELPFEDNFHTAIHESWRRVSGQLVHTFDNTAASMALRLADVSRRNVVLWDDHGYTEATGKRVVTELRLASKNARAGLVLNYHTPEPYEPNYFVVQLNQETNRVELLRFNGAGFVTEHSTNPPQPFNTKRWYQLETVISPYRHGVSIAVHLRGLSDDAVGSIKFAVATNRWEEDNGKHGVVSERSLAHFKSWSIENA